MSMISGMIGRFGQSVVIQRATRTEGGYTGDAVTWATLLTTTGVLTPLNGKDSIMLQKIGLEAEVKLYVEYSDIKEKDRVLYDNKYYNITYVQNPQMSSEFLQVYLKGSDNIGSSSQ